MLPHRMRFTLLILLALLSAAGGTAQDAPPPADLGPETLTAQQQEVQDRLRRLEDRMVKLTRLLAETEPDQAQRLQAALEQSGRQQIKQRISEAIVLLRQEQYGEADHAQEQVLNELRALLETLTSTQPDLERLRAERERLERLQAAVQALFDEQMAERQRLQQQEGELATAQALGELAEQLNDLARRQAELRERTNAGESAPDELAADQDALRTEAAALEEQLREMAQAAESDEQMRTLAAAAGEVVEALGEMRAAGRQLQQDSPDAAATDAAQQAAEAHLQAAAEHMRAAEEREAQQADLREIERLQRETQAKTQDLGRQMQPSGNTPATPGREQVEQAAENMRAAANRLGENDAQQAGEQQETALARLQRALDELDDALRQVRREEREEMLAALETRFAAMLERERQVRAAAGELAEQPLEQWDRAQHLRLAETDAEHRDVLAEAEAAHRLLIDEGTSIVLAALTQDIVTDMHDVAQRLATEDVGPATLTTLDAIIAQLEEIVEAVQWQRERERRGESDPSRGGQGGQAPLMPPAAELKLLKAAQVRINTRTLALEPAATEDAAARERFDRLSQRQRELSDLTIRIIERQ